MSQSFLATPDSRDLVRAFITPDERRVGDDRYQIFDESTQKLNELSPFRQLVNDDKHESLHSIEARYHRVNHMAQSFIDIKSRCMKNFI